MTFKLRLAFPCLVALALLTSHSGLLADEPSWIDGLAARVNDASITVGEVLMQVYPQQRKWPADLKGEALDQKMHECYRDSLNTLIEQKLILNSYEKQESKIPDSFVDERIQAIIEENFGGDRSQLTEALAKDHLSYPDWKKNIRDQIIIASMRQTFVRQKLHTSSEAMQAYYDTHTNEFTSPLLIDVNAIVVKGTNDSDSAAGELAREKREKLLAGTAFADVTTADDHGHWGWMQPSVLQPEFAAVVTMMKTNDVSDVLKRDNDFYIFGVAGRKEARPLPFDEVRDSIEAKLNKQASESIYAAWIARLKATSAIEIFVPEMPPR